MLLNFWNFYAFTFSTTCSVDVVKLFAVFVTKAVFNEMLAWTKWGGCVIVVKSEEEHRRYRDRICLQMWHQIGRRWPPIWGITAFSYSWSSPVLPKHSETMSQASEGHHEKEWKITDLACFSFVLSQLIWQASFVTRTTNSLSVLNEQLWFLNIHVTPVAVALGIISSYSHYNPNIFVGASSCEMDLGPKA